VRPLLFALTLSPSPTQTTLIVDIESEPSQARKSSSTSSLIIGYGSVSFHPQLQESGAERERALMMGYIGIANQGESRGERGHSACAAKIDLWGEADVRPPFSILSLRAYKHLSRLQLQRRRVVWEKRVWEGEEGRGMAAYPAI
jgi:hypothetical protein